MRESKNLIILSHWLPVNCWGPLPGDLDDFPPCTREALGALKVSTTKSKVDDKVQIACKLSSTIKSQDKYVNIKQLNEANGKMHLQFLSYAAQMVCYVQDFSEIWNVLIKATTFISTYMQVMKGFNVL